MNSEFNAIIHRTAGDDFLAGYPGGKSGAGIYQRIINLIPEHDVFISAFAGHCGIVRNIKPARQTIVIDADENVCQWWDSWRRTKAGRSIEIHHCDGIEWLRFKFGLTQYSATDSSGGRSSGGRPFVFIDPPYVLAQRKSKTRYACELSDSDHKRLVRTLTTLSAAPPAGILVCGYPSTIYAACDRDWRSINHKVPTRGGLQDERIWMNYQEPDRLHDSRFVGSCRRAREGLRRRQKNWAAQLQAMSRAERQSMLDHLTGDTQK